MKVMTLFSLSIAFQEQPEIPPTVAQATARNIPPEDYSYVASIKRLLCNKHFILLVITYGEWSHAVAVPEIFFCRCYGGARRFTEGAMKLG